MRPCALRRQMNRAAVQRIRGRGVSRNDSSVGGPAKDTYHSCCLQVEYLRIAS
jgi:hypothetical protein